MKISTIVYSAFIAIIFVSHPVVLAQENHQIETQKANVYLMPINVNTASVSQLQKLKGIGEVKALAIIEYRKKNGRFSSVSELVNVDGIGNKLVEQNKQMILF